MMEITSKLKSKKGMTLVEVMVVAVILAVVVMAVMSLFIPTVQSTAVQTEVADVQSNLRLAMDRMTDDLLTAGFLIGSNADPIIFESGTDRDPVDFTIQTALIGGGFARVDSSSADSLELASADMLNSFGIGTNFRIMNPNKTTNAAEIVPGQIYQVTAVNVGTKTLTINPTLAVSANDMVIVQTLPASPLIQRIRYRLQNGALSRTVNGQTQFLARGIDAVNFSFVPTTGRVRRVDIILTGRTADRIANGTSTQKTRELQTAVTLRNNF